MRIYLDTCCLMRPFDDQSNSRVFEETDAIVAILEAVQFGECTLVMSEIHRIENDANPHLERKQFAERNFLIAAEMVEYSEVSVERVAEWQGIGQRLYDARHLASAEYGGVEVFVTCDDNLIKRARRLPTPLRILNPVELFRELFP